MSDEFDDWMRRAFVAAEDGCACAQRDLFSAPSIIRPGQLRRLALHLLGLSGHAPGPLPAGELKAIRGRAEATADALDAGRHGWVARALEDRERLLSALDAVTADLAAAEGALADLCSPESGEANAAYLRGVEAGEARERARCAALLRLAAGDHRRFLPQATPGRERLAVVAIIAALERAADEVESPPAPAAARKGE